MYSSTLQQFQYTSVLEQPKADGAIFLKGLATYEAIQKTR